MLQRKEDSASNGNIAAKAPVQLKPSSAAAQLRGKSYDEQVQMLQVQRDDAPPKGDAGGGSAVPDQNATPPTGPQNHHDADGFSDEYQRNGSVHSHVGSYKDYKAAIKGMGKTHSSSDAGGTKMTSRVTLEDVRKIYDGVDADMKEGKVDESVVQNLVDQCNNAFETMLIDTVEARAAFFANAYSESNQFRAMTETQGSAAAVAANGGKSQDYATDPTKVKLDTGYLDDAAAGKKPGVGGYQVGGEINHDGGAWDKSFIGRGAIQTTHRDFYVQAIAVMEKRYDEMDKTSAQAIQLKEAIDKIKDDPRNAADPKYAFLFGAANMKMPGASGNTGDMSASRPGADPTSFMGPQDDKKGKKLAAFAAAKKVFKEREDAEKAKQQAAPKTEDAPATP